MSDLGRFWAPVKAGLTPDPVALALLHPHGQDVRADLEASLLGLHRVGAAACDAVAKGPVPDERALVNAMATARSHLADTAVDAVSKSMEANYAGLLVRDLFDDAEQGALDLFRSAVAKGVSPPLAATRAGAVYGVPFKELGRYAAQATDPKTNPVALVDLADRTLLGYVSKVAAAEAVGVKEVVSKAPAVTLESPATTRTEWDADEHPRGEDGRFARVATTTQLSPLEALKARFGLGAAPKVVVEPEPVAAPATAKPRPKRKQVKQVKQVKQIRQAKTGHLVPTADVATEAQGQVKAKTVQARKLSQRQETALLEAMAQVNRGTIVDTEPHELSNTPNATGLMARPAPNDTAYYGNIYEPLSFFVTGKEGAALREQMAGPRNKRIFRIGHLMEIASQPEVKGSVEAENWRLHLQKLAVSDPEIMLNQAEPIVSDIHADDELLAIFHGNEREFLEAERERVARENTPDGSLDVREYANIIPARDYADGNTVMVHLQAHEGAEPNAKRAMPVIEEFVITDEAQGNIEGTETHTEFRLNPNTAYIMSPRPETLYDRQRAVFVNRWRLRPVDDEEAEEIVQQGKFSKALATAERIEFDQEHPRDEVGRFTTTLERPSLLAPSALLTRARATAPPEPERRPQHAPSRRKVKQLKQVKTHRSALPARQQEQIQARTETARRARQAQATPQQQVASRIGLKRLTKAAETVKTRMPKLNEYRQYVVLEEADLEKLWNKHGYAHPGVAPRDTVVLDGPGTMAIYEAGQLGSDEVVSTLRDYVGHTVWTQDMGDLRMLGERPISSDEDAAAAVEWIDSIFDRDPRISYIEVNPNFVGGGPDKPGQLVTYTFEANTKKVRPMVIVELDEGVDFDTPLELTHVGDYTSRQIVQVPAPAQAQGIEDSDRMLNVRVQFYRASATHYRAGKA